ncbi:MAG TPA: TetR/AcrR family transcriptional regulator [Cyclobacteriaceae bacterium]|nr:TetR/AcrR family transcriptional regulator [Cyclobacteriaceae bacterium]
MRQPEATKATILKQSGQLFNTQGYKATSLSDITTATGLTKGAIYRHFKNKDQLEKEALFHLSEIMFTKIRERIKNKKTAPDKLKALFRFFETYISNPPVKGGCPLLNVSTEVDDAHPALRKQAVAILDLLRDAIVIMLNNGIRYGQLKPDLNKTYYSSVIIAMLEGAIMMSKLRGNNQDIKMAVTHLDKVLAEIEV